MEAKASEIASIIHANWQKSSGHTTRPKVTKDENWIKAHNGNNVCDIQIESYDELPSEYQKENYDSALSALMIVSKEKDVEKASSLLHNEWIKRNPECDLSLKVPYKELPENEKQKNRDIILLALTV